MNFCPHQVRLMFAMALISNPVNGSIHWIGRRALRPYVESLVFNGCVELGLILLENRLFTQGNQVLEGAVVQLRQPRFIRPDDRPRQFFLILNHLVDAFL
jgi:hypothetical protein